MTKAILKKKTQCPDHLLGHDVLLHIVWPLDLGKLVPPSGSLLCLISKMEILTVSTSRGGYKDKRIGNNVCQSQPRVRAPKWLLKKTEK
jgi:hypothetical protein